MSYAFRYPPEYLEQMEFLRNEIASQVNEMDYLLCLLSSGYYENPIFRELETVYQEVGKLTQEARNLEKNLWRKWGIY